MKNLNHIILLLLIALSFNIGCTNQRYVSSETDDIYYSASDRAIENRGDFNTVKEVSGEDYMSPNDSKNNNYYSIGREITNDQNPNSAQAYAESQKYNEVNSDITEANENATVVNNFYGNTTYSEGDYYDDFYASRIRRFDQRNVGYGYYDPFFIDPYWNYGWSAWNPYPRAGWSVGYNTWSGWNVGFNYGWGYPAWGYNNYCRWNSWNDPYFYNNPYMNGCYGGLGYYPYGYGYSPYRNGYWNGYRDGYYDGSGWGNNGMNNNSRPVLNSRTGMAGNSGFSGNIANDVRDSRLQNRQTLESTGMASNRNVLLQNDVKTNRRDISNKSNSVSNEVVTRRNDQMVANSNADVAASKYSKMTRTAAQSKYDLNGVKSNKTNTPVSKNSKMTGDRDADAYSGSSKASYKKNDKMNRSASGANKVQSNNRQGVYNGGNSTTTRPRGNSTVRPSSRTTTPSTYKSPRQVNRSTQQTRTTQSKPSNGNTRTRTTTPSQNRNRVSQPQKPRSTQPRTNSTPNRSKPSYSTPRSSPNVNRSGGASRSTPSRMSTPSRSSSPSRSPSSSAGRRR